MFVAPDPVEPNAELLAQITALQAQIEELRNAPEAIVEDNTAAAEAIDALTAQIADLQAASEAAQERFQAELTARDRTLEQLRMDLELAQLEANRPQPAPSGPTEDELRAREEERLRREEEARRLAELERRAAEERAFQERRIASPTIAFGGPSGAAETELAERSFGEVTDFVLNGALPSTVTQAEVIANPSNTIIQGTMIQAVMETALDSSLPGQTRAMVSEDVYSVDGTRLLIPRGSRLIGRYRSGVDIAQRRVTIAGTGSSCPTIRPSRSALSGATSWAAPGSRLRGYALCRAVRIGRPDLADLRSPKCCRRRCPNETAANALEDVGDDLADATTASWAITSRSAPSSMSTRAPASPSWSTATWRSSDPMSLSYLETSLDRIDAAARDDVIEICINPDGTCWGEFQGDHFMRALDQGSRPCRSGISATKSPPRPTRR